MLTGMVQCRHPDQIRQARQATEEYLKQLNALHPLGLPPAGRPTVSSEAIPYYFAWRRSNDGQTDGTMPSIGATGAQPAVPGDEAQVEAGEGLEGQGLEEDRGAEMVPPHTSSSTAPRAAVRARHDPTHPPAPRTSVTEGVAAADLEAGLVSTPPRRIFKPFKPLCKRRHKPLSPKIGSAYVDVRGDGHERGAQVGDTDAEDESSVISGESLGPPEFTTEYQRSFQWPKGFFSSITSKPANAPDRQRASQAGIRGAWAEGVACQRAGEADHLWELLKLAPTTQVAAAAGARPRTDQVWDLLLQPTGTMPPPRAAVPSPPPRATVEHELVVDEEGEETEAGEAPSLGAPLEGAVEPPAPTHAPVAPPSEPPTTPARRSAITSATATPARGRDRRGGGVGIDGARLQQQQRQAGEMERRGKRPMVAFGRTVRTPPPPASDVREGEKGGGGKQGRRNKLVMRGRKPVKTFRSSFNPIFMNPRYPTTRPGSPEHRHSVYQSSFSWPSVSPLMQSIS